MNTFNKLLSVTFLKTMEDCSEFINSEVSVACVETEDYSERFQN
jgi:hypothetical protein